MSLLLALVSGGSTPGNATGALPVLTLSAPTGTATGGGGSTIVFKVDARVDIGDVRPGPGPELILGAGAYRLDLTTGRFVKIISSTVVMTL